MRFVLLLLFSSLLRKGYTPQYKGSRCKFVRAARTGFLSPPDSQGSVLGQHRRVLVVFGEGAVSAVCSPVVLVYPVVPWDQRSPSLSETAGVGGLV